MRTLVGGLIAGVILYLVPGERSGQAYLLAGILLSFLLVSMGPRSIVERLSAVMTAALIAWLSGPRAAYRESLVLHLFGFLAAGSALAWYLRPRGE